MVRLAIAIAVLGFGIAGCGSTDPADRCLAVSDEAASALESGLDVSTGVAVDDWASVKSSDFDSVYFVAGHLTGPAVDEVGVWATNQLDGTGMYFAVDAMALEFSDWGDAGSTDAAMSMSDDGAQEAVDCLG